MDNLHIHEGDIIGLYNGQIHTVGSNVHDVTRDLMREIVTEDDELITVYYGKDTAEADAKALTDELGPDVRRLRRRNAAGGRRFTTTWYPWK